MKTVSKLKQSFFLIEIVVSLYPDNLKSLVDASVQAEIDNLP